MKFAVTTFITGVGRTVGNRTIEYDLQFLLAVLNWAVVAGNDTGSGTILERNPLRGLPLPKEKNRKRPALARDLYEPALAVSASVHPFSTTLLIAAHETGHRIGGL